MDCFFALYHLPVSGRTLCVTGFVACVLSHVSTVGGTSDHWRILLVSIRSPASV